MWSKRCAELALGAALVGSAAACGGAQARGGGAEQPEEPGLSLPAAEKQFSLQRAEPGADAAAEPLLGLLKAELTRSVAGLAKAEPAPYYASYAAYDLRDVTVEASLGALSHSDATRQRVVDVDVRVGDYALDNTHAREFAGDFQDPAALPLEDDELAVSRALWLATDAAYQRAQSALIKIKAERQVNVEEEDTSDDFSREKPARRLEAPATLELDQAAWEQRVAGWSARFAQHGFVERSRVSLLASASTRWFVNSEGSELQLARSHGRISIDALTTADDGSVLYRSAQLDAASVERLPDAAEVERNIDQVIADLKALREAPPGEPYLGPVLLDGNAAAVFFHEIFGHRVEGHRQKSELEGHTFRDQVGKPVMQTHFHVYDDPTILSVNGTDLNGHYLYDDEGVPGARASLIDSGVFAGFLMSRSPVRGFDHSNGHGRRAPGFRALSRQAVLVVEPERVTTPAALREALIAEVKRQKKPYGLRVSEVTGGYTMTLRGDTQAFKVEPVLVYRVYPDGREQLVRDVSLEGTPLSAIQDVLAAGNDFSVFNGYCGAESGDVPASAVSPSLLIRELEITRRDKAPDRPPLLPPPPPEAQLRTPVPEPVRLAASEEAR